MTCEHNKLTTQFCPHCGEVNKADARSLMIHLTRNGNAAERAMEDTIRRRDEWVRQHPNERSTWDPEEYRQKAERRIAKWDAWATWVENQIAKENNQ